MPLRTCPCGSGKPRRTKHDGYGIFLCFVCDDCEEERMSKFRSDIMTHYDCDEPIEPD